MFRQWLEKQKGCFQLTWTNIEFVFQISRLFVGFVCGVRSSMTHTDPHLEFNTEVHDIFLKPYKTHTKKKIVFYLSLAANKKLAFSIQQSAEKLSYKVDDLNSTED